MPSELAGRRVEQRDPVGRQVVRRSSPAGRSRPARRAPPSSADERVGQHPGAALGERPAVDVCRGAAARAPAAALTGSVSGRIEWAAIPANSARARVAPEASRDRASPAAVASSPNRASRSARGGDSGTWNGAEQVRQRASARRRPAGRTGRGTRRRRRPARAAVASTSPRSRTAEPSSSGWPSAAGGSIQRRPWPREVELGEERRDPAERVDRAADVVDEAGQRQLGGARPRRRLVGAPRGP